MSKTNKITFTSSLKDGFYKTVSPPHAENHPARECITTYRHVSKVFGRHAKFGSTYEEIYTCPGCSAKSESAPDHGDVIECECGLRGQQFGAGISFWRVAT